MTNGMFILIVKQRWWTRVGRVGIYPPSIWTIKTEKTNATKTQCSIFHMNVTANFEKIAEF